MTTHDVAPVEACEGAAIFVSWPKPPMHGGMWHGIFVHRFLEYYQTKGRERALAYLKAKNNRSGRSAYNVCKSITVSLLPKGDPEVEVLYEPAAGVAQPGTYRDTELDDHIYLKTDIAWLGAGGFPNFADYKTGDRSYDPRTHEQFKTTAVAFWLLYDKPTLVNAHVINITLAEPRWRTHVFQTPELEKLEARLRRVHAQMVEVRRLVHREGELPTFSPGDHCSDCRARFACKATSWKPEVRE